MAIESLFLEGYGPRARERLGQLIVGAKGESPLSPVTVIVPTTYAGLSLRRSLAEQNGLVNVRFMAFPRLAEYLGASELALQGKSPLRPLMRLAAIRHSALDMASIEPLKDIARHPPLHSYLAGTFTEMSSLCDAEESELAGKSPLLKQVVEWYQMYRGAVAGYYDREELVKAATDAVTKGKASSALKDLGFVIVYLVADLSPAETSLVLALGRKSLCAVILGLTGEEEIDSRTLILSRRLEPALGKPEASAVQPGINHANHIAITPDAHEEVRFVIRHIARSADEGTPLHQMAALYRNSDPYASLLRNQLDLAGIPAAGPDPIPLRDTPAGKLLVYMLEVFETDFARESVMRWVAETPVRILGGQEAAASELALWETISGKANVTGSAPQWQERLNKFLDHMRQKIKDMDVDEDGEPIGATYFQIREASAMRLKSFMTELVASPPPANISKWKDYSRWAGKMMRAYTGSSAWPQDQQDSYDRVMAILDELAELDTIEPGGTTIADFRQLLDDCLRGTAGRRGMTGTGVFVAPVGTAQGMEFDKVYILGMAEGAFPLVLPDDAIIPDKYREELGGGGLLPLRSVRRLDERRTFLAAMASGRQRILSYSRSGVAGQKRSYPSPWLVKEAEALRRGTEEPGHEVGGKATPDISSANLEDSATESWLSVIHSAQHGLESLARSPLAPADAHDYDMHSLARWQAAGHRIDRHFLMAPSSSNHRAMQMDRARRGTSFTCWDGNLAELATKSARLGIPADRHFSPTRLELWAKCPFQYFMKNVLEVQVLDRPEEIVTISPIDRGSLVHDILERFAKGAREGDEDPGIGKPWTEAHRKLLMDIAREEFDKVEALGITGRPLLWEVARHEIREDLAVFLYKDSQLRVQNASQPLEIECEFGFEKEGGYPAVLLRAGDLGQVTFRGIIDRVDADATGSRLWVIDYKSGSSFPYRDMKRGDLLGGGRHLQLPVYAMAIRNRFGDPCAVSAMYWFVTAKGRFEMIVVPLEAVEANLAGLVGAIASSIAGGIFPANPGAGQAGHDNCSYCDYKRVCPANCRVVWEKKSQDPVLSEYIAMSSTQDADEVQD